MVERIAIQVTFDARGYIGSAPELPRPVVALSLGVRRKAEELLPNEAIITLGLARPVAGSAISMWRIMDMSEKQKPTL
jgi:hypothetical protein